MLGAESLGEWIKNLVDHFADYIKPWVRVDEWQEAVIMRWGKYHRTLSKGPHPKWPIAEFHMLVDIKPNTLVVEPVAITTLDGKTIAAGLMIHFFISDSKAYQVDNNESESNMRDIAKAELSDLLEDLNWADTKKKTTKNALQRALIPKFKDMGVTILDLKFTHKCEIVGYKIFTDGGGSNVNAIIA